ncbi:acetyl-CoA acetyltransferase [Gordonia sp. KTR9]|uniref:acetyl-CoA acetyltransferase n=1 Tax=Gordonia sp. KTR9 TaxID=337191 RepID=UPI00027DDE8D|nr:acetyl-CoA acetyltransferase [Gordonia sp. KTR9]AFR49448.1 Acetyl-CoA acetyltransferase [Gordonia sp. KTR9]
MQSLESLDPRTPVIVGVGQFAERIDDGNYQGLSAVGLAAAAAAAALDDAGCDQRSLIDRIGTVAGIRQFENSTPRAPAPLGRSDNFPRSVADRIGADPAHAILEVGGGQSPQHLVTELSRAIALEELSDVALIVGSEAISTVRQLATAENKPDFSERRGGQLEDRGYGLSGLVRRYHSTHGLTDAPSQYALFENARRARLGMSTREYAGAMGELFAPFSRVAARNPLSAAPVERTADELATVSDRNRMIADPYPRFVVARDQVNQAAAVIITSVEAARELHIPSEKWVFIHGHADLVEKPLLERPDLSRSPAATRASEHALELAGIDVGGLATIDLYSCFPIAVFNVIDRLGIDPDDPRGLTVTGGLPFFGGAGNNYSMHALAETVIRLRREPGSFGFVGANGGTLSKYSAAVYSTTPTAWREDSSARIQSELDEARGVDVATVADGAVTIETYTIKHGRAGKLGVVVGRLVDGRRFLATTLDGDEAMLSLLESGEAIGQAAYVRSIAQGNRITTDRAAADKWLPHRKARLRSDYEFVTVHRDEHVLEVTIDRPEARNALTPRANDELDEVFTAFFDDPALWVAILTGAGDKAFSAGNDLRYSASGKPMWVPKNGFAGLTSRRHMTKPVIAAVNGFAMGGGFEIVLACHLVVADPSARFALSEVNVGLVAGAGGLVRLPRMVPEKLATEMILTGKQITAETGLAYGVINRVSSPGSVLDEARALAREIMAGSPTSVRVSLAVMNDTAAIPDTLDAVAHHCNAMDELMVSEDMFEGVAAFGEKRRPQWRNR